MSSRSRCGLRDMTDGRITDGPTLDAVTAVCREGGWAAEASGDGIVAPYSAPGTGGRWQF